MTRKEEILYKAAKEAAHHLECIDHDSLVPKIQDTEIWRRGIALDLLRDAIERVISKDRKDQIKE